MSRHTVIVPNSTLDSRHSLVLDKVAPGTYQLVGSSAFNGDINSISFRSWDSEVRDLDGKSDAADVWGDSDHLEWEDVVLTSCEFRASSLVRLREALMHVTVSFYNRCDV